jgi:hypothetical protein
MGVGIRPNTHQHGDSMTQRYIVGSTGGVEKVYEEQEVAGKESGLKVNYMCLIMPQQVFWEASRERSRSTACC